MTVPVLDVFEKCTLARRSHPRHLPSGWLIVLSATPRGISSATLARSPALARAPLRILPWNDMVTKRSLGKT